MAVRQTINLLRRSVKVTDASRPVIARSAGVLWLIPLGAGGYYGYNSLTETIKDPWEKHKAISDGVIDAPRTAFLGEILLYKVLPLRALSRLWGFVNDLTLPSPLRRPFLGWYVKTFGCDMDEAFDPDLANYPNLGALFRRKLKDGARPVDAAAPIVSPADGHVIWFGEVLPDGNMEQVKGVHYSLEKFLGNDVSALDLDDNNNAVPSPTSLLRNPEVNSLFHCLIYLAPGDYHRYHSPADWMVEERKHFPGELFSVSPGVTRWLKGLFNYNERVVYSGSWEHGFFCYAPVGATNVGSIRAYFDPSLATNLSRRQRKKAIQRGTASADGHLTFPNPVSMGKGDPFGEFNLGSSIVLVFEAPKNFQFHLSPGQKIQCGNYLGRVEQVKEAVLETAVEPASAVVDALPTEPEVTQETTSTTMEATPVVTETAQESPVAPESTPEPLANESEAHQVALDAMETTEIKDAPVKVDTNEIIAADESSVKFAKHSLVETVIDNVLNVEEVSSKAVEVDDVIEISSSLPQNEIPAVIPADTVESDQVPSIA